MAETAQKLVLSFDNETRSYKAQGHNLSAEQALEQVQKLTIEGLKAVIVDQDHYHRALSFHQCKPCKKAADQAGQGGQSASQDRPKPQDDLASAEDCEESESE